MSAWYLDTSAALKLIAEEAESPALAGEIDAATPQLVACLLLETELRRAAHGDRALSQELVSALLDGIDIYEVAPSVYHEAGLLPGPSLRSLDAIHLAAAIRLGVDRVVTYDARMERAARDLGLDVLSPA